MASPGYKSSPSFTSKPTAGFLDPVSRAGLSDHLLDLETMLFDPAVRRDMALVSDLMTEDFREFGSSGRIYTKMDILAELSTEQPAMITLSDFDCESISDTVALVTYKSLTTHEARAGSQALRSSLWVLRAPEIRFPKTAPQEGRWQMHFHQGTRF